MLKIEAFSRKMYRPRPGNGAGNEGENGGENGGRNGRRVRRRVGNNNGAVELLLGMRGPAAAAANGENGGNGGNGGRGNGAAAAAAAAAPLALNGAAAANRNGAAAAAGPLALNGNGAAAPGYFARARRASGDLFSGLGGIFGRGVGALGSAAAAAPDAVRRRGSALADALGSGAAAARRRGSALAEALGPPLAAAAAAGRSGYDAASEALRSRQAAAAAAAAAAAEAANVEGGRPRMSYNPSYPKGVARRNHPNARANIASGQLMTTWLERTSQVLALYQQEFRRERVTKTPEALKEALDVYARRLLDAYIRFHFAQIKHGRAKAAAPRRVNNKESNIEEEVNEPRLFGLATARVKRSIPRERIVEILQQVDAIVGMHPELAAEYGLEQGGANLGPRFIGATEAEQAASSARARAKIAANANAANFAGGRRKTRKGRKQRKTRKGHKKM